MATLDPILVHDLAQVHDRGGEGAKVIDVVMVMMTITRDLIHARDRDPDLEEGAENTEADDETDRIMDLEEALTKVVDPGVVGVDGKAEKGADNGTEVGKVRQVANTVLNRGVAVDTERTVLGAAETETGAVTLTTQAERHPEANTMTKIAENVTGVTEESTAVDDVILLTTTAITVTVVSYDVIAPTDPPPPSPVASFNFKRVHRSDSRLLRSRRDFIM